MVADDNCNGVGGARPLRYEAFQAPDRLDEKLPKIFSKSFQNLENLPNSHNPQNIVKIFSNIFEILSTSSKSTFVWKSFQNLQNIFKHF